MAKRLARASITAVAGGLGALAVVVVITLIRGGSPSKTISSPDFWIVEGVTVLLVFVAALLWPEGGENGKAKTSPAIDMLFTAGFATAGAAIIGVLIAVSLDEPIIDVLTSRRFLIVAGIGVVGATLSAWPKGDD